MLLMGVLRTKMRLDIYKDSSLAATFVYGAAPHFYGQHGQQVAALIAGNAVVHNIWTQETVVAPLPERADWWAARIISAPLSRAGFRLRVAEWGMRAAE
jgi:hypothetical protein